MPKMKRKRMDDPCRLPDLAYRDYKELRELSLRLQMPLTVSLPHVIRAGLAAIASGIYTIAREDEE